MDSLMDNEDPFLRAIGWMTLHLDDHESRAEMITSRGNAIQTLDALSVIFLSVLQNDPDVDARAQLHLWRTERLTDLAQYEARQEEKR